VSTPIHYRPGQLHACMLDDNTVALVMSADAAAFVRDLLGAGVIGDTKGRRRFADLVWCALNNLEGMPPPMRADLVGHVKILYADSEKA
jgi:hypothetical protein